MLKEIRIPLVIVIFVLSFAILFAGKMLYKDIYVKTPLSEELNKISEVENYEIKNTDSKKVLEVNLGHVDNLQKTYGEILNAKNNIGDKNTTITILDNSHGAVKKAWEASQFAVYQALKKGDFINMKKIINNSAEKYEVNNYRVSMDQNYIYIKFVLEDNYCYKVLPR